MRKIIVENLIEAKNQTKPTAFAFGRISSANQEDGMSLSYQDEKGINYATRKELYLVYSFSVTETGYKHNERQVFNEMLDLAEEFNVKHLIFKNTDRLSRNLHDLLKIEDLYENHGVTLHFYDQGKVISAGSTYDDKWVIKLLILLAEKYSGDISEKVRAAHRCKAERGIPVFRPPIGYRLTPEKNYIFDEHEEQVRWFFDTFDSGNYSLSEMVRLATEHGFRTRNGNVWHKGTLHHMLTSPIYAGFFVYGGNEYNGSYTPYVTRERFEARLKRMSSNFIGWSDTIRSYAFSRFVYCDHCGCVYIPELKKGKVLYGHCCKKQNNKRSYYNETALLKIIDQEMEKHVLSEDFAEEIKKMFTRTVTVKTQEVDQNKIHDEIRLLKIKQQRLYRLYAEEDTALDSLRAVISGYQEKIDQLERTLKKVNVNAQDVIIKVAELIDGIRQLPKAYKIATPEQKGRLLRSMASGLILSPEGAEIKWLPPYDIILSPLKENATQHTPSSVRHRPKIRGVRNETRILCENLYKWAIVA